MSLTSHRVVVTGIGMVTPLGLDTNTTWQSVLHGKSGISEIQDFDTSRLATKFSGTIKNFRLPAFRTKHIHKMDCFIQYGLKAAQEAIHDADLSSNLIDPEKVGVSIGSGMGGLTSIEQQSLRLSQAAQLNTTSFRSISPFFLPGMLVNMVAGICAIEFNFKGPNFSVASACATGAHNIGIGVRCIQKGEADVMIVGGAEKSSTPLSLAGFSACQALSTRNDCPTKASRPWDQGRDGFVLADGASVLVLESYDHATMRGAKIYGEVLGVGMSGDAYHITTPEPSGTGAKRAMQHALKDANILPDKVDYLNAHATSTVQGDISEMQAIKQIWGNDTHLQISATKSMTGHLLGAAGALEAAFCLLAIRDQIVPPTINLELPDPICQGLNVVPHVSQPAKVKIALSNAFGFGGTNISLIFGK